MGLYCSVVNALTRAPEYYGCASHFTPMMRTSMRAAGIRVEQLPRAFEVTYTRIIGALYRVDFVVDREDREDVKVDHGIHTLTINFLPDFTFAHDDHFRASARVGMLYVLCKLVDRGWRVRLADRICHEGLCRADDPNVWDNSEQINAFFQEAIADHAELYYADKRDRDTTPVLPSLPSVQSKKGKSKQSAPSKKSKSQQGGKHKRRVTRRRRRR